MEDSEYFFNEDFMHFCESEAELDSPPLKLFFFVFRYDLLVQIERSDKRQMLLLGFRLEVVKAGHGVLRELACCLADLYLFDVLLNLVIETDPYLLA